MTRIGLISDTHGYLDASVFQHFAACDEVWHAGDFGNSSIADQLNAFKPLRGVYGNIDGYDVRSVFPEQLVWTCEEVTVCMTHIGGYPPRYRPGIREELARHKAGLFICGHSHILKVMYDEKAQCLHMNPGAAGNQGWHKVRTLLRFAVEGKEIKNLEVIELGLRGK